MKTIPQHPEAASRDMTYLRTLPKTIPAGRVLVHNHVRPTRRLASRGFRAWLSSPDPDRWVACACGWAPELGPHYRVKREALTEKGDDDRNEK